MNAVIYARYSSDSQREESIEGQLRECREYAERNNMTIVGTYIDRALSAKTADRPEFQRMIKDSAKELFEIVLVWKLDRFSRDRYDSAHYKHILKKNGVKVVSAKEHISEGPEGIILEAMLEGYAEFYSAELSEKIHRGQKENALKGKNNGGGVPLGYLLDKKAQKLVIDPVTAPLVVEIFEKYADGKTVRSIVEDFNARGLRTKKGQLFNINSFSSLLKNRKYIGEYRYQDVVIEGGVPAIIPEDLFNRVQERMEKNRHAPAMAKAKEDYLLTTKLFCGKCERMMVGESGTSHTGAMHYYYKCGGAKRRKGCDKKAVRKDWIERVVVRLTMQRVMDEEKINRLIDAILVMQEQEDTTTPALRSQLAETESAIRNILKAIEQGIFTPSTKQRLDELEARKEEILVNIQTAELQKPKLTREQMTAWFEQFRHGDPTNREFQKRLIDTFVNAVYVFDDKLVLTYNYQHGTQTISLDEIESALSSDFDGATPPWKSLESVNFQGFFAYHRSERNAGGKNMRLICIGDSLTFGYGVHLSQRWTQLCAQETGWELVNEGINGDTTGGMLARMQGGVLAELREGGLGADRPYVLLMGGSNDVFYSGSDAAARGNMSAMIHQLFSVGVLPMVGIPLPADAPHAPRAWAAAVDFEAAERTMKEYCAWLKRYCTAFGVPYIDFCADFLSPDGSIRSELLLDGLHPTPEGHRLMARRLSAQLKRQG